MVFTYSYGEGSGMLYVKLLSTIASSSGVSKKGKYIFDVCIWNRHVNTQKGVSIGSEINKSFVFDGIVYYGNTNITVELKKRGCFQKGKTISQAQFRLMNCIHYKWMKERQTELGDHYRALTEPTKFTPTFPHIAQEKLVSYTLPFQELELPFYNEKGELITTLKLNTLFIPYAVCKAYEERPPLVHMAALLGDIPLLKRSIDVDNKSDIWVFNDLNPVSLALIKQHRAAYEYLLSLNEPQTFSPQKHIKNVLHYGAMYSDIRVFRFLTHQAAIKKDLPARLKDIDENGETPLFTAIRAHDLKLVKLLISLGAMIGEVNNSGNTPLMLSIMENQEDIALLLISKSRKDDYFVKEWSYDVYMKSSDHQVIHSNLFTGSAKPGIINKEGQNAMMLAAEMGMIRLLRKLINCGEVALQLDVDGNTMLSYALRAKQNMVETVCLLLGIKSIEPASVITSAWVKKMGINTDLVAITLQKPGFLANGDIPEDIQELLKAIASHCINSQAEKFIEEIDVM